MDFDLRIFFVQDIAVLLLGLDTKFRTCNCVFLRTFFLVYNLLLNDILVMEIVEKNRLREC